ncbi:MAG: hypothetical protein IJH13_00200 [Bacilli bacterium]|nr:hypothetical protein [Bacilli bacterium]
MFYDEEKAITKCEEQPALIFELMKEEYFDTVDKVLSKRKFDINVSDENGDSVLQKLLKLGQYDLVLKHMKKKNWHVNHQNNSGNTFAHILVTIDYLKVKNIMDALSKRKDFIPNIKNNNDETILDKSKYIYTSLRIIKDNRFNNIDTIAFYNLYKNYIKSSVYGKYSKLNNLELIITNLNKKENLLPRLQLVIDTLIVNMEEIKKELEENNMTSIDRMITSFI